MSADIKTIGNKTFRKKGLVPSFASPPKTKRIPSSAYSKSFSKRSQPPNHNKAKFRIQLGKSHTSCKAIIVTIGLYLIFFLPLLTMNARKNIISNAAMNIRNFKAVFPLSRCLNCCAEQKSIFLYHPKNCFRNLFSYSTSRLFIYEIKYSWKTSSLSNKYENVIKFFSSLTMIT